jgi:hypothetical protein
MRSPIEARWRGTTACLNRARIRLTTSAAAFASRMIRSTVVRARSRFGGLAASQLGVILLYGSEVVRVDACVQRLHQARPTRLIQVLKLVSQELAELLASVYRFAIRCRAVDHGR